ncbi:hypothetical protein L211DRAFT_596240 [Terfezia boudieri ATCC MYA-4762]|uniref:HTH CENPB-type domain-containing protein n=1 Tax=Terfezia boudieri ATCC MYA-4762 TaxID=1051890 RepID=A0A3N4LVL6_9PEZI|nr:hypothetical protein L211DRAFT_596240 [Terfezia boudieri ATCC MYA-4762]
MASTTTMSLYSSTNVITYHRIRSSPVPKPIAPRPVSPLTFYGPQVPRCPTTAIAIKREEEIEIDSETEDPEEIRLMFKRWRGAGRESIAMVRQPKKKSRKSYPQEYKMKALRMYAIAREAGPDGIERPISKRKCVKLLGITPKMLLDWISKGNTIKKIQVGARRVSEPGRQVPWPEMEARLYREFKTLRVLGQAINRKWFTRVGRKIFKEKYLKQVAYVSDSDTENENAVKIVLSCTFSDRWFKWFRSRWKLSWRQRTNVAQKSPAEKQEKVILFLQYIRLDGILYLESMKVYVRLVDTSDIISSIWTKLHYLLNS